MVGGRTLPVNRRQTIFPNGTLTIENVQRSLDEGTYTCVAKNKQGNSATGKLEVQVMGKSSLTFSAAHIHATQSGNLTNKSTINNSIKKKVIW